MIEYDITKIKQIFKDHGIDHFDVVNVVTNDNGTLIHVKSQKKEKRTLAEYCRHKFPERFKFKSDNEVYEVEKFYINIQGAVKIVFALRKDDKILDIISLYECENPNLFVNHYLDMNIDVVIKEDEK